MKFLRSWTLWALSLVLMSGRLHPALAQWYPATINNTPVQVPAVPVLDLPLYGLTPGAPLMLNQQGKVRSATAASIAGLWLSCTGYLKNDGTCATAPFTTTDLSPLSPTTAISQRAALMAADVAVRLTWHQAPRHDYPVTQVQLNQNFTAQVVPPTNAAVRVTGCSPSQLTSTTGAGGTVYSCITAATYARTFFACSIVSSDYVDFLMADTGWRRTWVDGVSSGYLVTAGSTGQTLEHRVALGDRRSHEFCLQSSGNFAGFITPDGASDLSLPVAPAGPAVALYANSLGEPTVTGPFNGFLGYIDVAADLLHWKNYMNYSQGGTDYCVNDPVTALTSFTSCPTSGGYNGRTNYLGHIAGSDGASQTFDAYIFAGGGINDGAFACSVLQPQIVATYEAAFTASPNAVVGVLGPVPALQQGYTGGTVTVDTCVLAAVQQEQTAGRNIVYLGSPGLENWEPQPYASCSHMSQGTINCLTTGDTTHPSQWVHEDIGASLAVRLRQYMPYLANSTNTASSLPQLPVSLVKHRVPDITGTWTFTSGSATITTTGGNALAEVYVGELLWGSKGSSISYVVQSVTDNNTIVLTATVPGYYVPAGGTSLLQNAAFPWAVLSSN